MELYEYWPAARGTAIYPDLGSNYIYPTLGLCGEAGETCEKIRNYGEGVQVSLEDQKQELKKELGDIMWYVANLKTELNLEVEIKGVATPEWDTLKEYGLTLSSYAAKVAEKVKKAIRDKGGNLEDQDRGVIRNSLCAIVVLIERIATNIGSSLEEVCQMNIDKLMSRKKRNVLQGEGDNR